MRIQGAIFDMDGLLLDTEKLYNRFWREAAKEFGYHMTYEDALKVRSTSPKRAIAILKTILGEDFPYWEVRERRCQLMEDFIDKNGVEKKPGAEELLIYLKNHSLRTALATSSNLERASKYLEKAGIIQYFDQIVCGNEVKAGKPEPDIFLMAAAKLELPPQNCIAFEDSPSGIRAAHGAGCYTVMIPDLDQPDEELMPFIDEVISDLYQVIAIVEKINFQK